MIRLLIICILLVIPPAVYLVDIDDSVYSGVYRPYSQFSGETYAGAWFSSLNTTYDRIGELKQVQNLEGASFFMVHGTDVLMTRDYFDFFIIHLSSMINVLVEYKLPTDVLSSIQTILSNRLRKNIRALETDNVKGNHKINEFLDVVVVIPFATKKAYSKKEDVDFFQADVRTLFLEVTFWSIYRYIPHIVVTYSSQSDGDAINELNLPIWHLTEITTDHYARQPKESLLYVLNNWHSRKPTSNITPRTSIDNWGKFKYIYFTEADEILYLRPNSLHQMLSILNKNQHGFKITAYSPHRMQTMPLPRNFPSSKNWNKSLIIDSLSHIDLITESVIEPAGSCCDDGRYIFDTCKAWWWYMCHRDPGYNYGAVNFTTWLRFGRNGFTFPTGTEHAGKCSYSNTRTICPIDQSVIHHNKINSCEKRIPTNNDEVCTENHYKVNEKIYEAKNSKK